LLDEVGWFVVVVLYEWFVWCYGVDFVVVD